MKKTSIILVTILCMSFAITNCEKKTKEESKGKIDTLSKKTIVSKKIKISEQKKDILKPKTVQLGLVEGDYILVNTNSSEPSTVKNKINIKLVGENEIMISDYVDPIEFTKKVKEDKITLNFGEYEQEGGDWTGGGEIVITNDNVKYKSIDGPGAEIISNYQKVLLH